VTLISPTNSFV